MNSPMCLILINLKPDTCTLQVELAGFPFASAAPISVNFALTLALSPSLGRRPTLPTLARPLPEHSQDRESRCPQGRNA